MNQDTLKECVENFKALQVNYEQYRITVNNLLAIKDARIKQLEKELHDAIQNKGR